MLTKLIYTLNPIDKHVDFHEGKKRGSSINSIGGPLVTQMQNKQAEQIPKRYTWYL